VRQFAGKRGPVVFQTRSHLTVLTVISDCLFGPNRRLVARRTVYGFRDEDLRHWVKNHGQMHFAVFGW
jgi:hypothetical protein